MSYIGIPPFGQTIRSITSTTATSGQTTFNITGGYVVGYVDVFLNGILLTPSDYTATNGTTVVLASGATTGDEFQALAYQPVSLVDTYRKSEVDSAISAAVAGVDLSSKVSKTGDTMTGALVTPMVVTDSSMNFRNRIINGDMRIDQRNAGAAVTAANAFPVDRFFVPFDTDGAYSAQQDSSAPAGFINSVKFTTTTADASLGATQYALLRQPIEGTNVADLGWGTANAKTVTLSFWVRSSLTGTFGGAVWNNVFNRSYPFTYSISVADTWEYKTVTIPGDTTGAWLTDNGRGVNVGFGLGVGSTYSGTAGSWAGASYLSATDTVSVIGTLNATWYVTGVQLEVGSVATPFERRPYGTELSLCQRYYQKSYNTDVAPTTSTPVGCVGGLAYGAGSLSLSIQFFTTMRATPSMTVYSQTGSSGVVSAPGAINTGSGFAVDQPSMRGTLAVLSGSGMTTNSFYYCHFVANAEL